jgi:hypothetical protein
VRNKPAAIDMRLLKGFFVVAHEVIHTRLGGVQISTLSHLWRARRESKRTVVFPDLFMKRISDVALIAGVRFWRSSEQC